MALSDPFSTTYNGSLQAGESLGQGINQAAGSVADVMKQKQAQQQQAKQRQQGFALLKQFGLVKQDDPTNDDLAKGLQDYGQKAGVSVNVNHGDNPDQERKNMMGIYKAMGIPMPQGQITVNPGVTMDMGGGASYTAPKVEKTVAQQVEDVNEAQKLLKSTPGMDNKTVSETGGKVAIKDKSSGGFGSAYVQADKEAAHAIAEGAKKGDLVGFEKASPIARQYAYKELEEQGYNVQKMQSDYTTIMQQARTAGGAPVMRMSTAVTTLSQSLDELDRLNQEYKRSDILPSITNKIKLTADQQGVPQFGMDKEDLKSLDGDQQELAIKYIGQLNFTKDSQALVYSGGYAPQQWAYNMSAESLSPYFGTKGTAAATSQARKDIQFRANAANQYFGRQVVPNVGGGNANPVLQAAGMAQGSQQQGQQQNNNDPMGLR